MPALSDNTAKMFIQACSADNVDDWATLRGELWPDGDLDEHRRGRRLVGPRALRCLLARDRRGQVLGFAEASLRYDYVNGCATSPVTFLEGLFVRTHAQRQGLARGLVAAVEHWARQNACSELASDTLLENDDAQAVHGRIGFSETERVVYFVKQLEPSTAQ